MMEHLFKISLLLVALTSLTGCGADGEDTEGSTGDRAPARTPGGFGKHAWGGEASIDTKEGESRARFTYYWVHGETLVVLEEMIGRDDGNKPIWVHRAYLYVPVGYQEYVEACKDENWHQPGIIVLVRKPVNYDSPDILRAWRADVQTWTFEELDPGQVGCCHLRSPMDY
jgi:hypothetical protein